MTKDNQLIAAPRPATRALMALAAVVALAWDASHLFLDLRTDLPDPPAAPQANIRIMVPDVDARWALVNENGARVLDPIGDRDYGLRDFTFADPDGFGLRFASMLEDAGS